MAKTEFIRPTPPHAEPAQPQPPTAVPARNGCETRRAGVTVDEDGNIVEMRHTAAVNVQTIVAAANALQRDIRQVREDLDGLAANMKKSGVARSAESAEPAFLQPTPYHTN